MTYRLLSFERLFLLHSTNSTKTRVVTRAIISSKTNTGTPAATPMMRSWLKGEDVVGGGGEAVRGCVGAVGGGRTVSNVEQWGYIVNDYIESYREVNTISKNNIIDLHKFMTPFTNCK